jgi:hypothetical protein
VRIHGSVSRCAVDCVGSPFSREQWDPSKSIGVSQNFVIYGPREIRMVLDHTRTEREKCVPCWSGSIQICWRLTKHVTACLWQSSRR